MKQATTTLIALIALCVAIPASAEYLPSEENEREVVSSRARVADFLESRAFVASRLSLRKYSSDVVADLSSIAKDGNVSDEIRSRAVDCLALYRSDARARKTVERLVETQKPGSPLFEEALLAFAQLEGERAVSTLAEFADSSKQSVRTAVVVALGRFGGQKGFRLLKKRAHLEQNADVRSHIERYVR